jgi:hypothetical protein
MPKNKQLLQEGDVVNMIAGLQVYAEVPQKYCYSNSKSNQLCETEIQLGIAKNFFRTNKFIGAYVVVKTRMTGGGTAHGPHDIYPDGHKVYLKKLKNGKWDEKGLEISFYQSGSFTCVIEPEKIKPVRKMKKVMYFV